MGKGSVDETHPLSVGVVGYFMAPRSRSSHMRDLVTEADVVLLVGNRTNQNGTDSWSLYPKGARYIHIDVDGSEIGRNYEAFRLAGDAKLTLAALVAALEKEDLSTIKSRPRVSRSQNRQWPCRAREGHAASGQHGCGAGSSRAASG